MLDLVPFAGAWRKVTYRDGQSSLIGEFLQLQFPQPQPPSVAAAAVGGNQDRFRLRINASALRAPPTPDGGYRKRAGVMVGSHIDESGVAPNVVNTVGIGTGNFWSRKVVTLHRNGLFCRAPLPASIDVVTDQFLLFGVDRYDRDALPQAFFYRGVDVPKLRIAIGMIRTFLGLAIALQAIVQAMKNLRNLHMADRMFLLAQFFGDGPRALANPAQRGLRIPARLLVDQCFQRLHQTRIGLRDRFAASTGAPHATHQGLALGLQFANAFADRLARQATGAPHYRHPAIAQTHRFTRRHDASRAFVQMRPC